MLRAPWIRKLQFENDIDPSTPINWKACLTHPNTHPQSQAMSSATHYWASTHRLHVDLLTGSVAGLDLMVGL